MTPTINKLETIIGIKFKHPDLLSQALTHRSYLNENKQLHLHSNERLEFLGDAVLELWVSRKLYSLFPEYPEGQLTALRSLIVRTENLAKIANDIDLGQYIFLSRGEENHGGRRNISILADTLESLIGAIFLDLGQTSANKFLDHFVFPSINSISRQKIYKDPKSIFQEIAQSSRGVTPHYLTLSETGPDHDKHFEVAAYINNQLIAKGKGNSKQKAEEAAATAAANLISQK